MRVQRDLGGVASVFSDLDVYVLECVAMVRTERDWSAEERAVSRRARILLGEHLTPGQRRCLAGWGYVPVRGSRGGRYRVYRWGSANVLRVIRLTPWCRLVIRACIAPVRAMPVDDVILAQMVLLSTDEPAFWRIAYVRRRWWEWGKDHAPCAPTP